MKDIQRVWALWWLAALPFILASIVITIVTGVTITASSQLTMEQFLLLVVTMVFGFLVFWKHPRLRHFNRVFAEHEENYRYVKEEPIIIDENWGTSDAGAPEEGKDYVA